MAVQFAAEMIILFIEGNIEPLLFQCDCCGQAAEPSTDDQCCFIFRHAAAAPFLCILKIFEKPAFLIPDLHLTCHGHGIAFCEAVITVAPHFIQYFTID